MQNSIFDELESNPAKSPIRNANNLIDNYLNESKINIEMKGFKHFSSKLVPETPISNILNSQNLVNLDESINQNITNLNIQLIENGFEHFQQISKATHQIQNEVSRIVLSVLQEYSNKSNIVKSNLKSSTELEKELLALRKENSLLKFEKNEDLSVIKRLSEKSILTKNQNK